MTWAPKKKVLAATGNSMLTIIHALLADPAASYTDLGAGYHEQRIRTRCQARNHLRSLERLGYKITIQATKPRHRRTPSPRRLNRHRDHPSARQRWTHRRALPPAQLRSDFGPDKN